MSPLLPLEARAAYGTEVPVVRKVKPVLPAGVYALRGREMIKAVHKNCIFRHQKERIRCETETCYAQLTGENRESDFGRTWDRRSRNLARPGRQEPGPNAIKDR